MDIQRSLTQRQKAAVIVRLLLDEEDDEAVSLTRLNVDLQTLLAEEMAGMELIDRQTRDAVINEFCENLEAVGVTFPGNLDGTLEMLGESCHRTAPTVCAASPPCPDVGIPGNALRHWAKRA